MPIKRLCCHAGCHRFRLPDSKYCEVHREADEAERERQKQEYLQKKYQHRPSRYSELYNTMEWRLMRAEYLKDHPFCECCGTTENLQVHHKYPEGVDYSSPEMFFNVNALETLCRRCHAKETSRRMIR